MRIFLAPMEGVIDHTMRAMLTRIGGIDRCVTEFIRITDQRLPARVFYRYCPELHQGGVTATGVPVFVQLLGGQPEPMALNAQRAAELGAPGLDINFGCPAKKVNRSDGGSIILREPERVFAIVRAVRQAVPAALPVTAKIRLGYEDDSPFREVVAAVISAGANELVVHARTKADGYRPPAYWPQIADVARSSPIPIIANGEIWSPANCEQCLQESLCGDVMLGRGVLANPGLARQIRALHSKSGNEGSGEMPWQKVLDLLADFSELTESMYEARYVGNRVKQWLAYLRLHYVEAGELFESIKRLREPADIARAIDRQRQHIMAA